MMEIKSKNSNSEPRKKPIASLNKLMMYKINKIREHAMLICGNTRFNMRCSLSFSNVDDIATAAAIVVRLIDNFSVKNHHRSLATIKVIGNSTAKVVHQLG